jgi:UDP-2,4-diacetamido-2,4,6-trideoxy-beta-L-altropyranose hydrolase
VTGARLAVRVDAGPAIGTGHAMRCLALARAWQARGGAVAFVSAALPDGIRARLAESGIGVIAADDAGEGAAALAAADWIVADGVHFTGADVDRLAAFGPPLLLIDDLAALPRYPARLVLNQNLHAAPALYAGCTGADLLLGPGYALIREEFWPWRGWRRDVGAQARTVLVTMGGADPPGASFRVLDALSAVLAGPAATALSVRIVAGAANGRAAELAESAGRVSPRIEVLRDVRDMGALYRWADVAVSACGSTIWELALFQTPTVLGTLAESEEPSARLLGERGACLHLGRWTEVAPARIAGVLSPLLGEPAGRARLSAAIAGLVDGRGADRVVDRMLALASG